MVFNNNLLLGAGGQGGATTFDTTLIGNSVWLDGSADNLSRSTSSHSSTEVVMACWFKRTSFAGSSRGIMALGTGTSGSTNSGIWLGSDDTLYFYNNGHGVVTNQLFRDIGWYHICASWKLDESIASNKGKLFINGEEVTSFSTDPRSSWGTSFGSTANQTVGVIFTNTFFDGYIAQPVMLDGQSIQGGDVAITDFVDTFTFGTNGSQIIPKADADIAALATTAGGNSFCLDFSTASVALSSGVTPTSNAGTFSGSLSNLTDGDFTTEWRSNVDPATNVSNDHVAFDLGSAKDVKAVKITGRSSATGNFKVQFSDNGSDFTDTGTTFSNVSITTTANSGILDLTSDNPGSHRYWKLINISNSSGTSGWGFREIILDSAVGNLGTDASGNGNDFTLNSMGSVNQSVNTPSKVYPVVNALTKVGSASSTLEEGNTKATTNDNGGIVITPKLPFSGLWYFEINVTTNVAWYPGIGQQSALGFNSTNAWGTTTPETHVWLTDHPGNYFNNNGSLSTYPKANPTTGRFAVAWDGDNRALYFGQISGSTITWTNSGDPTSGSSKTGAAPGNWPTTGTDPLYFIVLGGGTSVMEFDFDEDDWTGVTNRPADAKALNSENLTAPDYQGIDYFNAVKYTGNGTAIGSGGKAVTGTGFKPDLVWIKNRDAADSHAWYDVVRGTTKQIESDTTAAESTESEGLTTFGSDGFTVGNLAQVNTSTEDYVAWQWLGRNSTSTNTNGSLNTTVTVATADHFSIVGWTMSDPAGAKTLGHGLSAAPELIIVKNRTDAGTNWPVYAEVVGNTKYMYLSTTAAAATFNMWQDTSPTSTVFSVSSNNEASGSANDEMIAYCFRSVPGMCKVGSYEGNGSTNGTYVSLGFKPALVLFKSVDSTSDWQIFDKSRNGFNVRNNELEANDTATEDTSTNFLDLLSDGFKLRIASDPNVSETYIYLAMADIGGNGTLPPIYGR